MSGNIFRKLGASAALHRVAFPQPSTAQRGDRALRVFIIGLRGFPGVQGGVETHVENLVGELAKAGCRIEVAVRSPYVERRKQADSDVVRSIRLWSPRSKYFEALVHSFLAVLVAAVRRPDIVHVHAIGPSLVVPLARLFGLKVVMTHHGMDYNRQKWNFVAKKILQLGEMCGARFANERIAVSSVIAKSVSRRFGVPCQWIPNGVKLAAPVLSRATLEKYGLADRRYILMVGRIVPEKCHLDLIAAFTQAALDGWKLVFVGGADHHDKYQDMVVTAAKNNPLIVTTGVLSGEPLAELYSHAGMFVLPSSHEGFPIVLLEALSFGLPVVASRIAANTEVGLDDAHYFQVGNVPDLVERIRHFSTIPWNEADAEKCRLLVAEKYAWAQIAERTLQCYQHAIEG